MPIPESKTCTKCGEPKPLSDFHRDKTRSDGRAVWCAVCSRARRNSWYQKNRDANLAYQAEWRDANREHKRDYDQAWLAANRDRKVANDQKYRVANRERLDEQIAAWRRANPQRVLDIRRNRRARLRGAFVAPVLFHEILVRDLGICGICNTPILESTVELDHIIPLAAGGTHEPDNVQLAHRSCNRRKWMKVPQAVRAVAPACVFLL